MVGVGMTPPKVLGMPKPASSVMISRMLGASLGGTTVGGHQGVDCKRVILDHPAELRRGRRQLVAADGGVGAGRAQLAVDLRKSSVSITDEASVFIVEPVCCDAQAASNPAQTKAASIK